MAKPVRIHDRTHQELLDVLAPPFFEPTGEVKTAQQAISDGDWTNAINIWLYARTPEPSLVCQLRSPHALWEPYKLDMMAASGYYKAGTNGLAGLKELREELGITVPKSKVQFFGRKLNVGIDAKGRERRIHMQIYIAEYEGALEDMQPQEYEVYGVFIVPLKPLMDVIHGKRASLEVSGMDARREPITYTIKPDSFPYNFDNYQQKMAEYIALKLGVDDAYLGN